MRRSKLRLTSKCLIVGLLINVPFFCSEKVLLSLLIRGCRRMFLLLTQVVATDFSDVSL